MPIDYSKWKNIEVSDDEDDTHPNIDTVSMNLGIISGDNLILSES